jgi:hypothetical protein
MKILIWLEKRFFPNDSYYQRKRRRVAIFFGVTCSILLVWGVAVVMTKVSNSAGRKIDRSSQRIPGPSLDLK